MAQTLEHFFKFFLILIDNHLKCFQIKLEENFVSERTDLLFQISELKDSVKSYEEALFNEKSLYEKEYDNLRQKLLVNQETISILSKDLGEINKELADSKSLEKADENFSNLFKSINSFSGYLNKIDEENVFFTEITDFIYIFRMKNWFL